jgi:hypothetical protein
MVRRGPDRPLGTLVVYLPKTSPGRSLPGVPERADPRHQLGQGGIVDAQPGRHPEPLRASVVVRPSKHRTESRFPSATASGLAGRVVGLRRGPGYDWPALEEERDARPGVEIAPHVCDLAAPHDRTVPLEEASGIRAFEDEPHDRHHDLARLGDPAYLTGVDGLVAHGAAAPLLHALLAGDRAGVVGLADEMLPAAAGQAAFGSDLTAVGTGPADR